MRAKMQVRGRGQHVVLPEDVRTWDLALVKFRWGRA